MDYIVHKEAIEVLSVHCRVAMRFEVIYQVPTTIYNLVRSCCTSENMTFDGLGDSRSLKAWRPLHKLHIGSRRKQWIYHFVSQIEIVEKKTQVILRMLAACLERMLRGRKGYS